MDLTHFPMDSQVNIINPFFLGMALLLALALPPSHSHSSYPWRLLLATALPPSNSHSSYPWPILLATAIPPSHLPPPIHSHSS